MTIVRTFFSLLFWSEDTCVFASISRSGAHATYSNNSNASNPHYFRWCKCDDVTNALTYDFWHGERLSFACIIVTSTFLRTQSEVHRIIRLQLYSWCERCTKFCFFSHLLWSEARNRTSLSFNYANNRLQRILYSNIAGPKWCEKPHNCAVVQRRFLVRRRRMAGHHARMWVWKRLSSIAVRHNKGTLPARLVSVCAFRTW